MHKIVLPLLASLALASPALANETRVEARGGAVWNDSNTEALAGVAAGYDYDLGQAAFGDVLGVGVGAGAVGRRGVGVTAIGPIERSHGITPVTSDTHR